MTVDSAAEADERHVGRYGSQLAAGLIEVAGARPGQRALDVGCGPGPLTAALAELLGAANLAAIDPFEPYVEAYRRRVLGADMRVGVAESLPRRRRAVCGLRVRIAVGKGVRERLTSAPHAPPPGAFAWGARISAGKPGRLGLDVCH